MHPFTALAVGALAIVAHAASTPVPVTVQTAWNSTSADTNISPRSNSWSMNTWSGTSCTGIEYVWSAPDGASCTNLAAVSSLDVTNLGGCSTTYYTGSNCQDNAVHVGNANYCDGYLDGSRIESFQVIC